MESNNIEKILEKYFDGLTSSIEEKQLTSYFTSSNVAPHLEHYRSLFEYFSKSKEENWPHEIPLQTQKRSLVAWLSIAATITLLVGVGTFLYQNQQVEKNQDLGTFDNPELAFKETQKALQLISQNVNVGINSVSYLNEYQVAKDKVFQN